MHKINQAIQKLKEKMQRGEWWLLPSHIKNIEAEAKKNWGNNQSALMRHIINNWFKK